MSTREEILGRVREALAHPSHPDVKRLAGNGVRDPRGARGFLPPGGETPDEMLEHFSRLAGKLKVEVIRVPDSDAAAGTLSDMAKKEGWDRVASHHAGLTDRLVPGLDLECLWTDDGLDTAVLEACPVGITVCEALIAQTGSVLVTNTGCGGRALSVLPPHHIVLATRDQLCPDMLSGYDHLRERYGEKLPTFISFITGASRTGDIERILVLGAHGPKRLTLLLQDTV